MCVHGKVIWLLGVVVTSWFLNYRPMNDSVDTMSVYQRIVEYDTELADVGIFDLETGEMQVTRGDTPTTAQVKDIDFAFIVSGYRR